MILFPSLSTPHEAFLDLGSTHPPYELPICGNAQMVYLEQRMGPSKKIFEAFSDIGPQKSDGVNCFKRIIRSGQVIKLMRGFWKLRMFIL